MVLVIAIPVKNADKITKALDKCARFDWRSRNEILVIELPEGIKSRDAAVLLCEKLQGHTISGNLNILVPDRIHIDNKILIEAGYSIIKGHSIANLQHGQGLSQELKKMGLDWESSVLAMISRYALAQISEDDIKAWLRQFERLGNHRPVGAHLLQLVEILAASELAASLSKDSGLQGNNLIFGFNHDQYGKSWGTVINLVKKNCPLFNMLPSNEAIDECNDSKHLWIVEDGLFSGTETQAVFDSLRGVRPANRTQKVPVLQDVNKLSASRIKLRFGAICDFGLETLTRYLSKSKLLNVHIETGYAAKIIKVLGETPDNKKIEEFAQDDDNGDHAFLESLRVRVDPYAFQNINGWKDATLEAKARAFCEEVGQQLWVSYINQKKNFDTVSWPEDRIKRCSLGMEGLGLTFAFTHSVPKASLPIFWAKGEVTFGGQRIMWNPLFPSANN